MKELIKKLMKKYQAILLKKFLKEKNERVDKKTA